MCCTSVYNSQRDLRSIEWSTVVARFLALQSSGRYRVAIHKKGLTAHDIARSALRLLLLFTTGRALLMLRYCHQCLECSLCAMSSSLNVRVTVYKPCVL
jgi:hypothetical protein